MTLVELLNERIKLWNNGGDLTDINAQIAAAIAERKAAYDGVAVSTDDIKAALKPAPTKRQRAK
ncbi:hypothetical protein [Rhodobacter capsulatus]|uniref:hypothetical protein n=1 Tax=Rhodobacter capsulatus TaxID=1061 RepID=UPI0040288B90